MSRKLYWLAAVIVLATIVTYTILLLRARPVLEHPFFESEGPMVIAHRGGSALWPENTLRAFQGATTLGVDVLEMDVHTTADDVLVVFHDASLDRTTNGTGAIREQPLSEIQALDAGYHWTEDAGASYPFRGRGFRVPTMEEVFQRFPHMRLNLEIKQSSPRLSAPLCQMIRAYGMEQRVLVASFDPSTMRDFRAECPEVATSATALEIRIFMWMHKLHLENLYRGAPEAFEVPPLLGDLEIVTPQFLRESHGRNIRVYVWTVNEVDQMKRLVDLGVDGILTDRPDKLLNVLGR
jgi:glycerophosphoryl diester phosphodiesterase